MIAHVFSLWVGIGVEGNEFRPKIIDDYIIDGYLDVTGQSADSIIPSPNLFVAQIECLPETLAQIELDPAYFVLWSEP